MSNKPAKFVILTNDAKTYASPCALGCFLSAHMDPTDVRLFEANTKLCESAYNDTRDNQTLADANTLIGRAHHQGEDDPIFALLPA